MSQRREHRLRNLEKQYCELENKYHELEKEVVLQGKRLIDMKYALRLLRRIVYDKSQALPPVPWYKRLFRRPSK